MPEVDVTGLIGQRLTIGKLQVYLEPRDLWVGAYIAQQAVFVCPLPLLVFRWRRHD